MTPEELRTLKFQLRRLELTQEKIEKVEKMISCIEYESNIVTIHGGVNGDVELTLSEEATLKLKEILKEYVNELQEMFDSAKLHNGKIQ